MKDLNKIVEVDKSQDNQQSSNEEMARTNPTVIKRHAAGDKYRTESEKASNTDLTNHPSEDSGADNNSVDVDATKTAKPTSKKDIKTGVKAAKKEKSEVDITVKNEADSKKKAKEQLKKPDSDKKIKTITKKAEKAETKVDKLKKKVKKAKKKDVKTSKLKALKEKLKNALDKLKSRVRKLKKAKNNL